ncbi:alpha-1-antitrypsin-like protein CM55-ST [Elgaria multicarinata webbii]|uniref:alpha-1-antitrypsin-like protein CM55-ST n=1 Tax=Elgaria multicarinata webbii TaxID=159646 RepID=UPI002FCCF322
MKSIIYLSLLVVIVQVHGHHLPGHQDNDQDSHPPGQRNKTTAYQKIVPVNADFAFRLYRHIISDGAAKNVFFSPISIFSAVALLTLGAKSETHHQILKGLGFNLSEIEENEIHEGFQNLIQMLNHQNNEAQVNVGNTLFINESLKILPKFLENVKTFYEAECFSANFNNPTESKKQINDYVKTKTHGKIAHAVQDLDPTIVMVLVNHIFFQAYWKNPFKTESIREEDFFVDAATTVKVNMMFEENHYNYVRDESLSCWVVEVPYKGDASALFILPDEGKMDHVERGLTKETLTKWRTSFTYDEIQLYLPQFSISTSLDVKDLLQRLGITDIFNDNADLSGITGERNLKVSKVLHKAFLDVHENGTEAAAVTIVKSVFLSARLTPPLSITFIRPFLVNIYSTDTDSLDLIGKVVNPSQQ